MSNGSTMHFVHQSFAHDFNNNLRIKNLKALKTYVHLKMFHTYFLLFLRKGIPIIFSSIIYPFFILPS